MTTTTTTTTTETKMLEQEKIFRTHKYKVYYCGGYMGLDSYSKNESRIFGVLGILDVNDDIEQSGLSEEDTLGIIREISKDENINKGDVLVYLQDNNEIFFKLNEVAADPESIQKEIEKLLIKDGLEKIYEIKC